MQPKCPVLYETFIYSFAIKNLNCILKSSMLTEIVLSPGSESVNFYDSVSAYLISSKVRKNNSRLN